MTDDQPKLAERRDLDQVYQPAEDSHLLAETAREAVGPGERALDVGAGSGYVATALAEAGAAVLATDVNPLACRDARAAGLDVVQANLTAPFQDGVFDLVTFNPPYLPTPPEEAMDDWMERALSGGENGRAVIEPFLATVGRVLAPDGRVLLLVSTLTDIEAVRQLATDAGFSTRALAEESHPFERLVVLEIRP